MPTTINGIGTSYYGRKNESVRGAHCKSCNRYGNLVSYDTGLYFVVVFIPILPLGRKRILDQCPSCQRHFVLKLHEYESAKQLQVSGALDDYRQAPTPQNAITCHGTLIGYHEFEQAKEFREEIQARFPDDADFLVGLGTQVENSANPNDALPLYESALDIDHANFPARTNVARFWMVQGKLDESRELLDFLQEPGAGQRFDCSLLDNLALRYQAAGGHSQALQLWQHLVQEHPAFAETKAFQKNVRKSEKAIAKGGDAPPTMKFTAPSGGRASTPEEKNTKRNVVIGLVVAAVLTVGAVLNNQYISNHRKLKVINQTGETVQVQIDGGPIQPVGQEGDLVVSEGTHHVKMTGPVNDELDINLQSDFFGRWFAKPYWILNPGGEAVIEQGAITYAENPPPTQVNYLMGQRFMTFPSIDYPFIEPPARLQVNKRNQQQLVKTALRISNLPPVVIFRHQLTIDRSGAIGWAQDRLRHPLDGGELLDAYVMEMLQTPTDLARAEKYLKTGLTRRPVDIPWHRSYQTMVERGTNDPSLIASYDEMLKADPKNAALLYLRGRITPNVLERDRYFQQAMDADRYLGWPIYAFASRAASQADWKTAREQGMKALATGLKD
jgi:tetratricopeptide (TPR) repeat protein